MIKLEDIHKYYSETHVLKGVNLSIEKGEFIAVTGSSGSGKSTLLNLIGGMDRPDKGRIVIDGEDNSALSDERLTLFRRKKVGFVFQFFNLLPDITVFENIRMPLLLNNIIDKGIALDYIRRVGLQGMEDRYPFQLSGGQQQRVAIARALVHNPEIILTDEPTGSLDSETGKSIMDLIEQLSVETRKTVILVTHEPDIAAYAGRKIRIRDGIILG